MWKSNSVAVTVDVEDWYHVPAVTGSPFSKYRDVEEFFKVWNKRYDYVTEPTNRILELLDSLGIRATFFVVADITDRYPGLVEQIAARGHELACHGLHHACKIHPRTKKPLMSPSEFEARTKKAKDLLEQASGREVIGYRAPAAYVAGWMLDSLERLGFRYDSSVAVNSFYNKSDSKLSEVDTRPYYPKRGSLDRGDERRAIVELPWPYYRRVLKLPSGGGPLLRFLGSTYVLAGLTQSLGRGPTLFYFHPVDISRERFPSSFSWRRPLYWVVKGDIVESRIRRILGQQRFKFVTCASLAGGVNHDI